MTEQFTRNNEHQLTQFNNIYNPAENQESPERAETGEFPVITNDTFDIDDEIPPERTYRVQDRLRPGPEDRLYYVQCPRQISIDWTVRSAASNGIPSSNPDDHDNHAHHVVIEWKEVDGQIQTNTQLVEWSDGSWTLEIQNAKKHSFECHFQPSHGLLFDSSEPSLLMYHGVVNEKMVLRPADGGKLHRASHRRPSKAMQITTAQQVKEAQKLHHQTTPKEILRRTSGLDADFLETFQR